MILRGPGGSVPADAAIAATGPMAARRAPSRRRKPMELRAGPDRPQPHRLTTNGEILSQ